MKELWNTKVSTSRNVRMNSAMGIVFIPKTEYVTPAEIEPLITDQAEDLGIPVSEVYILYSPSHPEALAEKITTPL